MRLLERAQLCLETWKRKKFPLSGFSFCSFHLRWNPDKSSGMKCTRPAELRPGKFISISGPPGSGRIGKLRLARDPTSNYLSL